MDHDAIICSMIDRLARGPDQDVHVPSVVGPKYPSRGVDAVSYTHLRAHDLLNFGELLGPATISPCTITMDHDAIICSMIDRLARGPDQDVHVPSVVGPKYPSRGVDVVYL